jgi:FkbM family methyltransferase
MIDVRMSEKGFFALSRLRFDILIRNAIRDRQQPSGLMFTGTITPSDAAAESHSAAPQQKASRSFKRAILALLSPLKPLARQVRRLLVGHIEASIEALRARNDVLLTELQQQTQLIQQQFARTLELTQLLHAKIDDAGLRSRGVLAVDDATFAMRTYDGFILVPRQDTLLLIMLLDAGPQGLEPGTRRVISKLLRPGMTFVDVGAHIGLLTLAGARAVGPKGKVLAVEPVPLSFDALRRALAINSLTDRVVAVCQAVGAQRERCRLLVGSVLGHSSLIRSDALSKEHTAEIEVEVSPLDDLIEPNARVDLVKIDVEGAELAVLEGMTRIIADNPDLAIIAEFGPSHLTATNTPPEKWLSAFRDRGFEPWVIDESSSECRSADLAKLVSADSVNILFARHDSWVLTRASQ